MKHTQYFVIVGFTQRYLFSFKLSHANYCDDMCSLFVSTILHGFHVYHDVGSQLLASILAVYVCN